MDGVKGRSPFYDLPYFRMDMVQYDLMHSAVGVLAMPFKAFNAPSHPWYLTQTQRTAVSLLAPSKRSAHVHWPTDPCSPLPRSSVRVRVVPMQTEAHLRKVQRPYKPYLRKDLKPLTQLKYPRAAEWLKMARGGHLSYLVRHLIPPRVILHELSSTAEQEAWIVWARKNNEHDALHWMCTYIDALCAPELDAVHMQRIRLLRNKAAWHWYKCLPQNMWTMLAHAMWHLTEQAAWYGPQSIFWLFHKERSPSHAILQTP